MAVIVKFFPEIKKKKKSIEKMFQVKLETTKTG